MISQEPIQEDNFKALKTHGEGLFKDRGSKFIGLCHPVASAQEAMEQLQVIKGKYHDARHHCFAYRANPMQPEIRFNDDGEPSNSAGTPIYNQILSGEVWNVLVVVVRYFGGTKLGVSGLINAYKTAAQLALENAKIEREFIYSYFEVRFPYNKTGEAMRLINESGAEIVTETMAGDAGYHLRTRLNQKKPTFEALKKLPGIIIKELL